VPFRGRVVVVQDVYHFRTHPVKEAPQRSKLLLRVDPDSRSTKIGLRYKKAGPRCEMHLLEWSAFGRCGVEFVLVGERSEGLLNQIAVFGREDRGLGTRCISLCHLYGVQRNTWIIRRRDGNEQLNRAVWGAAQ
jgi:hypothetical protein